MADTIKEFLVGLGWQNNDAQYLKFSAMLEGATLKANLLAVGLEEGARKIAASVASVAEDFEKLYYQSIRTGQSAASIKEFTFAASQLGSTVGAAAQSLENIGTALRKYPDGTYITYLNNVGLSYDKVTKKIEYNQALAEKAAKTDFWQEQQWAEKLGIDDNTLKAMRKAAEFQARIDESRKSMAAAGLDPAKAAADAVAFGNAQRTLFNDLENDYNSLVATMMKSLTPGLEGLDTWLKKEQPDILKGINAIAASFGQIVGFVHYLANTTGSQAISDIGADLKKEAGDVHVDWFNTQKPGTKVPFSPGHKPPTRGLSLDGKDISLERATDSGTDGTAFGPREIKTNGSSVASGNPLPVSIDTSGKPLHVTIDMDTLGSSDGGGGGFLGAIGAGVRRLFGGGGGNGGERGVGGTPPAANGNGGAAQHGWWNNERLSYAYNYFKKAGLSEDGAAGLVARMAYREGMFGPGSTNPRSGAYGIGQWLGPRKRGGALGDFDSQLAYAVWEGEHNPSEMRAFSVLKNAKDYGDAARGGAMFERAEGYNAESGTDTNMITKEQLQGVKDIAATNNAGAAQISAHGKSFTWPIKENASIRYGLEDSVRNMRFPSSLHGHGVGHSFSHNSVIHIHGAQDPEITARMVGAHVHRINQDLTRDMVGATQ